MVEYFLLVESVVAYFPGAGVLAFGLLVGWLPATAVLWPAVAVKVIWKDLGCSAESASAGAAVVRFPASEKPVALLQVVLTFWVGAVWAAPAEVAPAKAVPPV